MEDDIRKLIINKVYEYYEEKYEEMDSIYRRLCDEAKDIYAGQNRILKRMDEVEKLIHSHAIGVQNVYDEFKKINDFNNIGNIDSQMLINGILK